MIKTTTMAEASRARPKSDKHKKTRERETHRSEQSQRQNDVHRLRVGDIESHTLDREKQAFTEGFEPAKLPCPVQCSGNDLEEDGEFVNSVNQNLPLLHCLEETQNDTPDPLNLNDVFVSVVSGDTLVKHLHTQDTGSDQILNRGSQITMTVSGNVYDEELELDSPVVEVTQNDSPAIDSGNIENIHVARTDSALVPPLTSFPDVTPQIISEVSVPKISVVEVPAPEVSLVENSIPEVSLVKNSVPEVSLVKNSVPEVSLVENSVPELEVSFVENSVPEFADNVPSPPIELLIPETGILPLVPESETQMLTVQDQTCSEPQTETHDKLEIQTFSELETETQAELETQTPFELNAHTQDKLETQVAESITQISTELEHTNVTEQYGGASETASEHLETKDGTLAESVKTQHGVYQQLYPKVPAAEQIIEGNRFRSMSIEELQRLYYNPELQRNPQFIENFVRNEQKKSSFDFHEILMNYHRARKNLLSVEEDLKSLRENYEHMLNELWILTKKSISVEGQCADGNKVSKVHTYEQCEFNKEALENLATCLRSIRHEMQGDLALFAYSSQMSRLQVESYLHTLFMSCPSLWNLQKNSPISATDHTRDDLVPQVEKLKECISVLFAFHRKPIHDREFVDNARKWTERLVSALLRVASYSDHLFILNHILRSPAGVGQWAASLVQIPAPISLSVQTTFGSPVLDHAVTCLATVLLPVTARDEFMCHMQINVSENSIQTEKTWILVDSDGDEDEDPVQSWLYLHENDIVSVLEQFPMVAIFAHLLQAPIDESGNVQYDIKRCTEPNILKLFAFCTTWITLLGAGLNTYSMARYRQLNKRLGRYIRQTIAFVSDHWLNFKTYYRPLAANVSLERLQIEFDQLFMRATYTILTAQKLGSWQFMADMPFTCLSAGSIWQLLWLLQQHQGHPVDLDMLPPVDKCKKDMQDLESHRQLADTLQSLPTSESVYLLTTFANMAAARPLEENDFIECITLQVFEIAYICDHTRDICSKIGRDLLSSIIQKHPTALSMLLRRVQVVMPQLGMASLYLFHELPASIWIPQDPDMTLLRQWLLNSELSSAENQLARVVLERMNWNLFTETGRLVLDIRLHRQVALLLAEAYNKFIPDRRASYFIVEGMKQMASYVTQQSSREQQFNNWAWALAMRLKLHKEGAILHSQASASLPFQAPSLEQEQWLLPLTVSARAKNPLGCFLALAMTDVGHDQSQFMAVGLDMLLMLTNSSQYTAVIHILSCITPLFISTPQYLLENEMFLKILQMVLCADDSVLKVTKMVLGIEFPGTVTRQFTQMIQAMISARLNCRDALQIILFWTRAIFKLSKFLNDQNCCYVLDNLVRWGYLQKGAQEKLDAIFRDYFKLHLSESKSRGGLLTWMGGGSPSQPSLMERASLPQFGWLATEVLHIEGAAEVESGIWPALQQELLSSSSIPLETAFKTVVTQLRPESVPSIARLSIYRWGQQALDMPMDHALLPVVWQRFFSLFLGRGTFNIQLQSRGSVGERFFQSSAMSVMLKKMKKRLKETADFHMNFNPQEGRRMSPPPTPVRNASTASDVESLPSPTTEESPEYNSSMEFHQQLARLYQTFLLWLDEPRLHGSDLYLPALPVQYEASRLLHIFTPGNAPWLEFVDFEGEQYQISITAAEWRNLLSGKLQIGSPPRRKATLLQQPTATERIRQRLQRFPTPKLAPPVYPITPPVPEISPSLLLDKASALHLLEADLSILTDFTKFFFTRAAQQCATDSAYIELIPGQQANVAKQVQVLAECRSRVNLLHRCSGPACIPVRVEERQLNAIVQRKIDENRAEYKQLMIEAVLPPPQNVCIAAVHVENAITLLIKMSQKTIDDARREILADVACALFFHLAIKVTEETNFYPPTKQFFAFCVEILGQEYLSHAPQQTPLLLQFCLDNEPLAGLVSPHFVPNNSPENFVSMYEQLITVLQQQNLNLVFMLLTKFDIWSWLDKCRPGSADKKRFLEVLGSALLSCGAEPSAESKLVFELYLAHLRFVLMYQFPDSLSTILIMLLEGSSCEGLHTSCWEMFLMQCCSSQPGFDTRPVKHIFNTEYVAACTDISMSTEKLQDTLKLLGAYFMRRRVTDNQAANFGLYPRWGRYVPYLALLMGLLARSFIAKIMIGFLDHSPYQVMQVVWQELLDVWRAWLEPLPPESVAASGTVVGERPLDPWTESDSMLAVKMVEAFKSSLLFTHATLTDIAQQFSSTVFSLLLMYYMTVLSHRSTPCYVSDVLVAEFSQLPWEQLKPDLQLLEIMAQMKERCTSSCFQLVSHILPKVMWPEVMDLFKIHHEPRIFQRLQAALLLLLVQCYGDCCTDESPDIVRLLSDSINYDWVGIPVDSYRTASFWFMQICKPQWVLSQRSSVPALGFRLMKNAAEFTNEVSQPWTPEMSVKRHTYVHCVTQQVCQVTYLPDSDLEAVKTVLVNLLSEIESVESAIVDVMTQEEESLSLMKDVLGLLNNSNPSGSAQSTILQTFCHWLQSSPQSILLMPCIKAASRCLASMGQMALITETCVQVHSSACKHVDQGESIDHAPRDIWGPVLSVFQVPELNLSEYIKESLGNGSYLMLYVLLLHRRSLCQRLADEANLMEDIVQWTSQITPSADNEPKPFLWWHMFFQLMLRQVDYNPSPAVYISMAKRLVCFLHQLGEDRASTGFFGVLGFGKRSQFSLHFRFAVRSLAAFLATQIVSDTLLRLQTSAPLSDMPLAKQVRTDLISLRTNNVYLPLREKIEKMCSIVTNTEHTINYACDLVKDLVQSLYPDCEYLTLSLQ